MYKPAKGSDYVGKELFPPFCKHKTNPWITQSSHYCKIMLGKNSFTLRTTLSSVQRLARILHKVLQIQIGGLVVSERSEEREMTQTLCSNLMTFTLLFCFSRFLVFINVKS